jgi:hypothetical protein
MVLVEWLLPQSTCSKCLLHGSWAWGEHVYSSAPPAEPTVGPLGVGHTAQSTRDGPMVAHSTWDLGRPSKERQEVAGEEHSPVSCTILGPVP